MYIGYCVDIRGLEIKFPAKIQENYAEYLIKQNDKFVDKMLEFEDFTKEYKREFSEEELNLIAKNIEDKNNIMIDLQQNPPDYSNKEYAEIYKDILKVYAFYIQGEVLRVEYISNYKSEYTMEEIKAGKDAKEETYIMGVQLCNMMGSLILENPTIVNEIKDTNIPTRYETEPIEEWMEKFNKALERSKNQESEDNKEESTKNKAEAK